MAMLDGPDLEKFTGLWGIARGCVALLPGEEQPQYAMAHQPPDGFRWETDAEFRARVIHQTGNPLGL